MMRLFVFLAIAAFFTACGSDAATGDGTATSAKSGDIDQLVETVVAKHDEVMPLHSEITRAETALTRYLRDNNPEEEVRTRIIMTNRAMDHATDLMMSWMAKMGNTPEQMAEAGRSEEEIRAFWEAMHDDMNTVEKSMRESLAEGQHLVQELGLNSTPE